MTIGYDDVTFGTKLLNLKNLNKKLVTGTLKQKIGGTLIKYNAPGRSYRDMEISGQGVIFDTNVAATTQRRELEEMHDFVPRVYTDGMHQGTYIMEELSFDDDGDNPMLYTFTVKFIQFQQPL